MTTAVSEHKSYYSYWWVYLLEGIAAVGLGILLFMQPAATLVILTTFLGAFWLVDGVFKVIGAIMGKNGDRNWWLFLLSGIIGIIAGLIVLGQPLMATVITQVFLVYMLAIQAIISGIISIIWAISARKEIQGEGWTIVGGILSIILGVLLFSNPLISILTLVLIAGVVAVVGGIGMIIASFRLRSARA